MRTQSLFGHLVELLEGYGSARGPADNFAREFFRERRYLGSFDRRWIGDRFFGVLRNLTLLDALSREALKAAAGVERDAHPVALSAVYAVRIRREDPADVAQAVEMLWRMAGLPSNPQKFLESMAGLDTPVVPSTDPPQRRLTVEYSFPESIVEEWLERFGEAEAEALCRASNEPAPPTIRVNTLRTQPEDCRTRLAREGIEASAGTAAPHALVLPGRVNLPSLQTFRDGFFEIQDEGSQLITQLLDPRPGEKVVDACAGGGGKALHAAALMKNQGSIVAIDTDGRRLEQLRFRSLRSGADIVEIVPPPSRKEELRRLSGKADAVLIDAPCSGVGTFRRSPDSKLRFTVRMSEDFARTQSELLETNAPLVRPGGRLVYATCTLLRRENEDVVEEFLSRHPEFSPAPAADYQARTGLSPEYGSFLLLLPHRTGTDGFFAALLTRAGAPAR